MLEFVLANGGWIYVGIFYKSIHRPTAIRR